MVITLGWVGGLGCATTPAQRAEIHARELGFSGRTLRGDPFLHRVFLSPPALADLEEGRFKVSAGSPSGRLHVYLSGDGSPPRAIRTRPPDPTPQDLWMLDLMAVDPRPGLFLGRPCYHGVESCEPEPWTRGRYSAAVVRSLVATLRQLVPAGRPLVLIGHSGGGTLAMLMAPHLEEVEAVVTVAGNLDVGGFTSHHGFLEFESSLDPALAPPLRDEIWQLHLLGGRDQTVPAALSRKAVYRQPGAELRVLADVGHNDGWTEVWPQILEVIDHGLLLRNKADPVE